MVAHLLHENWAPFERALQSLAQDWIERFLHLGIQQRTRESKGYYILHLFKGLSH